MKKILIFLSLIPSFAIAQDTVIISKIFADDTLWSVKKVYANQDVQIKSFEDSSAIYYYILNDVVDYFVVVESTITFSSKPKQLLFQDNKHLFDKFKDKIIYVVIDDSPISFFKIDYITTFRIV